MKQRGLEWCQKRQGRAEGKMEQALKLRQMGAHCSDWFMAFMRIWK